MPQLQTNLWHREGDTRAQNYIASLSTTQIDELTVISDPSMLSFLFRHFHCIIFLYVSFTMF